MSSGKRTERGFTYLAMLIAVALIGIGLVAGSEVWSHSRQREKEQELLFVGEQFRRAIGLYYERTPGAVKRYPEKLQDLLEDKRYVTRQRYLRRLYVDPMTGKPEWGVVAAPDGGVMGIYSLSTEKPVKSANFSQELMIFEGAQHYNQWRFIYQPVMNPVIAAPPPARRMP
jgi:type II secretory pathway pseudopilin PulG